MKGKGKGKDMSNNNKDCPLQYPKLTPVDMKMLSECMSFLDQTDVDINLDNLEVLQYELEKILVSVLHRRDTLDGEMETLTAWLEKKPKQTKEESGGKKSKVAETKPSKKSNTAASNSTKKANTASHSTGTVGRPKNQASQSRSQDIEISNSPLLPLKLQRNEIPNRFWEFLKPYCADITPDYIKFLEEWAKPISEDDECFKIPPLGKHYSYEWSNRDLQEEQKEGAKANDKRKSTSSNSSLNSSDTERMIKRARRECVPEEPCPFGPLTQRLVSCLINENIMTPLEDTINNVKDEPEPGQSNGNIIKSLNIGNAREFEKRIRKRLEFAGILDADQAEANEEKQEDEVLAELEKAQMELRAISTYNLGLKQKLLELAKKEVVKQEKRKKLELIDAEILKMTQLPKDSLTKQRRKKAEKLLKDRQNLVDEMEKDENS